MRNKFNEFMQEHKSLFTLKKTDGFLFALKPLYIYTFVYIVFVLLFTYFTSSFSLDFVYLITIFGSLLIGFFVSKEYEQNFKDKTKHNYSIYTETIFMCFRVLLVETVYFSYLFIIYYSSHISIVTIIVNALLLIILLVFEVLKLMNGIEEEQTQILHNFVVVVMIIIATRLSYGILDNISLETELLSIIIGISIVVNIKLFLNKFTINKWIWISPSIILFVLSLVFGSKTYLETLISSDYFVVTENIGTLFQLIEEEDYNYYHLQDDQGNDVFEMKTESGNLLSYALLPRETNTRRYMYELDGTIYVMQISASYYNNDDTGYDVLYLFDDSGLTNIYESEVIYHGAIGFMYEGNYTYFVNHHEGYQIIDSVSVPLEDIYSTTERLDFIKNDEFQIFVEDGTYYYYQNFTYPYVELQYHQNTEYSEDANNSDFVFYYNSEGLLLSGFNSDYEFFKDSSTTYIYKEGVRLKSIGFETNYSVSGLKDIVTKEDNETYIFYKGSPNETDIFMIYVEDELITSSGIPGDLNHNGPYSYIVPYEIGYEFLVTNQDSIYLKEYHLHSDDYFYQLEYTESNGVPSGIGGLNEFHLGYLFSSFLIVGTVGVKRKTY